jgi:hypothetical protein
VGAAVLDDIQVQGFVYYRLRRGATIDPHASVFCDGARSLALLIKEKVQEGKARPVAPEQTHARTDGWPKEGS